MDVFFRTDASIEIGTGHVMRCLTLAEALRECGTRCRFICREHPGNLLAMIGERGFESCPLPAAGAENRQEGDSPYAAWLGADWETDARQTSSMIGSALPGWLIADHYSIDARWEHLMRSACKKLMVIDDLANRPHDCDLLLDQNLGRRAEDYENLVPAHCALLAGPRHALLRPEFAALRPQSMARRHAPELKNILVSMGGVDKGNAMAQVLEALRACVLPEDCHITIVMGRHAPWVDSIRGLASHMPWKAEVLVDVKDMASLMVKSDLAICAAGSTSWECCCLALPAMLIALVAHQQPLADALNEVGAAKAVPYASLKQEMIGFFHAVNQDISCLASLSAAAATITDGQGTGTVTRCLLEQGQT